MIARRVRIAPWRRTAAGLEERAAAREERQARARNGGRNRRGPAATRNPGATKRRQPQPEKGGIPLENKKLTIGLFSGGIDKLTAASVIISGAAAHDMDIEVYVLMQGARVFLKDVAEKKEPLEMAENPKLRGQFIEALDRLNVKPWLDALREAKETTNLKIYVCGLAGKIWGGMERSDFIDIVDDIVGIGECLDSMEKADIHLFI
jgi:peroxiredoxin family protein